MNRPSLAVLALFAALAPAAALAQADPHAGMAMQDHATMQAAPTPQGVVTSPADNFMGAAPTAFSVTFPHPMTLTSVKLTSAAGQAVDVAVASGSTPSATVSAPLPALAPGSYSAAWSATGADGHQMNGVVRFMVH
ncbi:MAG: hypothetical protein A2792_01475 [Sphingomonadales bacterium RIFCSPHIGHO2_01_FULL_65_20]|nr:MAG: hypothetical protein A2792_01475 [Sphingomonadales bacterium RIFCSPHIGHO2_01_FULL_65_20]